jgi:hypothetical protein
MFNLPIPRFDAKIKLHRDLAAAAEEAETRHPRQETMEIPS